MTKKTLVIDGMALLFRHFYATSFRNQFMYNGNGIPTNAVQGVIRHSLKLIETLQPTHVVMTWDMGKETIRNEWFKDYKSNRTAPPAEMIPQFDYVKKIIDDMGIYQVGLTGYEADDIIGTLSTINTDSEMIIVSGDRDLLQLLNPSNRIWLTKKGFTEYHHYTKDIFEKEYGITPDQFIDVKALMGDSSDGYPGVKGIGEKTALKLIKNYGSIDDILQSLDMLTPNIKGKIENDLAALTMSKKLATIITDAPVPIEEYVIKSPFQVNVHTIDDVLLSHDLEISRKYLHTLNFQGVI
jgi:5'-3' exonuclease